MKATRVLAVALILAAGAIGFILLRPPRPAPVTMSGGSTDTPGPSPTYDTRYNDSLPITHGAFAVTNSAELLRSLAWEPADVTSHLISFETYTLWQGSVISSPDPMGPVWLVAFSGTGLTMGMVNNDIGAKLGPVPSSTARGGGRHRGVAASRGHLLCLGCQQRRSHREGRAQPGHPMDVRVGGSHDRHNCHHRAGDAYADVPDGRPDLLHGTQRAVKYPAMVPSRLPGLGYGGDNGYETAGRPSRRAGRCKNRQKITVLFTRARMRVTTARRGAGRLHRYGEPGCVRGKPRGQGGGPGFFCDSRQATYLPRAIRSQPRKNNSRVVAVGEIPGSLQTPPVMSAHRVAAITPNMTPHAHIPHMNQLTPAGRGGGR